MFQSKQFSFVVMIFLTGWLQSAVSIVGRLARSETHFLLLKNQIILVTEVCGSFSMTLIHRPG